MLFTTLIGSCAPSDHPMKEWIQIQGLSMNKTIQMYAYKITISVVDVADTG